MRGDRLEVGMAILSPEGRPRFPQDRVPGEDGKSFDAFRFDFSTADPPLSSVADTFHFSNSATASGYTNLLYQSAWRPVCPGHYLLVTIVERQCYRFIVNTMIPSVTRPSHYPS